MGLESAQHGYSDRYPQREDQRSTSRQTASRGDWEAGTSYVSEYLQEEPASHLFFVADSLGQNPKDVVELIDFLKGRGELDKFCGTMHDGFQHRGISRPFHGMIKFSGPDQIGTGKSSCCWCGPSILRQQEQSFYSVTVDVLYLLYGPPGLSAIPRSRLGLTLLLKAQLDNPSQASVIGRAYDIMRDFGSYARGLHHFWSTSRNDQICDQIFDLIDYREPHSELFQRRLRTLKGKFGYPADEAAFYALTKSGVAPEAYDHKIGTEPYQSWMNPVTFFKNYPPRPLSVEIAKRTFVTGLAPEELSQVIAHPICNVKSWDPDPLIRLAPTNFSIAMLTAVFEVIEGLRDRVHLPAAICAEETFKVLGAMPTYACSLRRGIVDDLPSNCSSGRKFFADLTSAANLAEVALATLTNHSKERRIDDLKRIASEATDRLFASHSDRRVQLIGNIVTHAPDHETAISLSQAVAAIGPFFALFPHDFSRDESAKKLHVVLGDQDATFAVLMSNIFYNIAAVVGEQRLRIQDSQADNPRQSYSTFFRDHLLGRGFAALGRISKTVRRQNSSEPSPAGHLISAMDVAASLYLLDARLAFGSAGLQRAIKSGIDRLTHDLNARAQQPLRGLDLIARYFRFMGTNCLPELAGHFFGFSRGLAAQDIQIRLQSNHAYLGSPRQSLGLSHNQSMSPRKFIDWVKNRRLAVYEMLRKTPGKLARRDQTDLEICAHLLGTHRAPYFNEPIAALVEALRAKFQPANSFPPDLIIADPKDCEEVDRALTTYALCSLPKRQTDVAVGRRSQIAIPSQFAEPQRMLIRRGAAHLSSEDLIHEWQPRLDELEDALGRRISHSSLELVANISRAIIADLQNEIAEGQKHLQSNGENGRLTVRLGLLGEAKERLTQLKDPHSLLRGVLNEPLVAKNPKRLNRLSDSIRDLLLINAKTSLLPLPASLRLRELRSIKYRGAFLSEVVGFANRAALEIIEPCNHDRLNSLFERFLYRNHFDRLLTNFRNTERPETVVIESYPTDGLELSLAGYYCDTCATRTMEPLAEQPEMLFFPFVWPDAPLSQPLFFGGTCVIAVTGRDDKRYLMVRAFNPNESAVNSISMASLFENICNYLWDFAKAAGYNGIVVPYESRTKFRISNRPEVFNYVSSRYFDSDNLSLIALQDPAQAVYNHERGPDECVVIRGSDATSSEQPGPN